MVAETVEDFDGMLESRQDTERLRNCSLLVGQTAE